jgi:hypothetical protein
MYRSKRKIPQEQKKEIEETLARIKELFAKHRWLVCLDKTDWHGQRSTLHGIGPNPYGRVDRIMRIIYVDFQTDMLAMFIHQCLHALHPNMLERDVTILELIIIENITPEQAVELLRLMVIHSLQRLFSPDAPIKTPLMLDIEQLFKTGHWLVFLDQLRGDTDLSMVYELGRWCCGFVEERVQILYIDFREDLLSTFMHEALHAIYPDAGEPEIRQRELAGMKEITPRQAQCLLSLMLQNIY